MHTAFCHQEAVDTQWDPFAVDPVEVAAAVADG